MKILFIVLSLLYTVESSKSDVLKQRILKRHFDENESSMDKKLRLTKHMQLVGGPVMVQPLTIVLLFYGKHETKTIDLITHFVQHLGKSSWWQNLITYHNTKKRHVSDKITLKEVWQDNYSHGKEWTNPGSILERNMLQHKATNDPNTLYAIIISKDVIAMDFCKMYCGFHRHARSLRHESFEAAIKYAVVMDTMQCPGKEGAKTGCLQSPYRKDLMTINGDASADGIVNILAHEIAEAVTDPVSPYGWTDGRKKSFENGDKCNQMFGTVKMEKGIAYNVEMGKKKFLLQEMWNVDKHTCSLF